MSTGLYLENNLFVVNHTDGNRTLQEKIYFIRIETLVIVNIYGCNQYCYVLKFGQNSNIHCHNENMSIHRHPNDNNKNLSVDHTTFVMNPLDDNRNSLDKRTENLFLILLLFNRKSHTWTSLSIECR